jgi:endonuclease IV
MGQGPLAMHQNHLLDLSITTTDVQEVSIDCTTSDAIACEHDASFIKLVVN